MKVEVRSNIEGEIMKIRNGVVFHSRESVIDELLQNCQRAKATCVDVDLYGDQLTFKDDGIGCSDPQMIFEKHTSAWGDVDDAFGEGFFSVFMLADIVTIRSHDWGLVLDVNRMMDTHDMYIDVQKGLVHQPGFSITLRGPMIADSLWTLEKRMETVGSLIEPQLSINGRIVDKVAIDEVRPGERKYEDELATYYVRPRSGYGGQLEIYYDSRHVTDRYYTAVNGRVILKKGHVTPKAPDRRELVRDSEFYKMDTAIRGYIRDMYKQELIKATPVFLDTYAKAIQEYIPVEEYAEILPLPSSLIRALNEERWGKILGSMVIRNDVDPEEQKPPTRSTVTDSALSEGDAGWLETLGGSHDLPVAEESEEPLLTEYTPMKALLKMADFLLWVPHNRVSEIQSLIKEAEYKGYSLLYPANDMYESALRYLGIPSVEELDDHVKEQVEYEKLGPRSKKEKRFMVLMRMIEDGLGLKPGTIQLGTLNMSFIDKKADTVIRTVEVLGSSSADGVVIDRSVVNFPNYRAQAPDYPNITNHDYKALMRALVVIAHELAHFMYGYNDNTVEHNEATQKLSTEIAELF